MGTELMEWHLAECKKAYKKAPAMIRMQLDAFMAPMLAWMDHATAEIRTGQSTKTTDQGGTHGHSD